MDLLNKYDKTYVSIKPLEMLLENGEPAYVLAANSGKTVLAGLGVFSKSRAILLAKAINNVDGGYPDE